MVGQFLAFALGPETVGEVVVLDRREFLHETQAAVMVGEQQSFGRDDFARAAATELHDGVLDARLVEVEDLFRREFAAHGLHLGEVLPVEGVRQPHAFVGACH